MRVFIVFRAVLAACSWIPSCGKQEGNAVYSAAQKAGQAERRGSCRVMQGEVSLFCLFVETDSRPWQEREAEQAMQLLRAAAAQFFADGGDLCSLSLPEEAQEGLAFARGLSLAQTGHEAVFAL